MVVTGKGVGWVGRRPKQTSQLSKRPQRTEKFLYDNKSLKKPVSLQTSRTHKIYIFTWADEKYNSDQYWQCVYRTHSQIFNTVLTVWCCILVTLGLNFRNIWKVVLETIVTLRFMGLRIPSKKEWKYEMTEYRDFGSSHGTGCPVHEKFSSCRNPGRSLHRRFL